MSRSRVTLAAARDERLFQGTFAGLHLVYLTLNVGAVAQHIAYARRGDACHRNVLYAAVHLGYAITSAAAVTHHLARGISAALRAD